MQGDNLCRTFSIVFPDSSVGKESARNAGDPSSIPGSGSSPGEGIGGPLLCSLGFPCGSAGKETPAMLETWVRPLV